MLITHSLWSEWDSVFRWARRLWAAGLSGAVSSREQLIETWGTTGVTAPLVNSRRRGRRRQGQQSCRCVWGRVQRSTWQAHPPQTSPTPSQQWQSYHETGRLHVSSWHAGKKKKKLRGPLALFTWITVIATGRGKSAASSLWKVKITMGRRGLIDVRRTPDSCAGWLRLKH